MFEKRRKALIVLVLLAAMVSATFGLLVWGGGQERAKEVEITVEKVFFLVGEIVNLSVSGAPRGANVTWDFGDGGMGYGNRTSHVYQTSDFYNVIATVTWREGEGYMRKVATRRIEIRNRDVYRRFEGGPIVEVRPLWIRGSGGFADIYPGTTNPTVYVNATLRGAVGGVGIEVDLVGGEEGIKTLADERQRAAGEDIIYNFEFSEELQPLEENMEIQAIIWVYEGKISSWVVHIEVHY